MAKPLMPRQTGIPCSQWAPAVHPADALPELNRVRLSREEWIAAAAAVQAPHLKPGEPAVHVVPLPGDEMTKAGAISAGNQELGARMHMRNQAEVRRVERTGTPGCAPLARPSRTDGELRPRGPGGVSGAARVAASRRQRSARRAKLSLASDSRR